jgi:type I restriction enzyme S subunit
LQLLSVYRDYGVIPKDSRSDNFNKTPEDITRYQEVRVGDLVVNKMKAWQGSVGISAHHGIVSPDYLVCSVDPSVDSRFMHHLLRSAPLAAEFGARSKGIRPAQWRLYWEDLAEIPINLPVLDEQRRIADFLNAETTRIDRLASLRSRQLAQLDMRERAWRAHLLEQSKSGVRMRVKHLLCVKPRYGVLVPEFVDEGVPFIRVNSISGLSSLDGLPKIPKALSKQYARTVTGLGDILLSVVGSMGKATIVTEPLIGANVARAVAVLRLNLIHIPSLFTAWIGTAEFEQQAQLATGADSAQPTLGMEDLANFSLRWPTDGFEEKDMAMAVEEHQLDMEATRITLNRQLSLLAERRQALITAAVTGGITI